MCIMMKGECCIDLAPPRVVRGWRPRACVWGAKPAARLPAFNPCLFGGDRRKKKERRKQNNKRSVLQSRASMKEGGGVDAISVHARVTAHAHSECMTVRAWQAECRLFQ